MNSNVRKAGDQDKLDLSTSGNSELTRIIVFVTRSRDGLRADMPLIPKNQPDIFLKVVIHAGLHLHCHVPVLKTVTDSVRATLKSVLVVSQSSECKASIV